MTKIPLILSHLSSLSSSSPLGSALIGDRDAPGGDGDSAARDEESGGA